MSTGSPNQRDVSPCTSLLQVHVNVKHLGIRQFRCNLCEYSAGQKVHLLSHMERVHNGGEDADDEEVKSHMKKN